MIVGTTMLCSVAEYRRFARIEGSAHDHLESVILDLIVETTQRIWQRLGGDQSVQTYNDSYDIAWGDERAVVVDHGPVQSVVAMTVKEIIGTDVLIDSDKIWFRDYEIGVYEANFGLAAVGRYENQFGAGIGDNRLHICYTAGHSAQDLKPLQLALKAEVSAWMMSNGYEDMLSIKEGDTSYQFVKGGWCRRSDSILTEWGSEHA